jgi:predicted GTPase
MDTKQGDYNYAHGLFGFHKERLRILFTKVYQFCAETRYREALPHLERARAQLDKEKLTLAAVGEFKKGKSSLINAYLDELDLLPVDIDVTTSINTMITYSATEVVTAIIGTGRSARKVRISRAQIRDYVTEQRNANNKKDVSMVVIETPSAKLADGLVVYDTPGIGNVNRSHEAVTFSILPTVDIILFITEAEVDPLEAELEFIEKRLAPLNVPLLFALTKTDLTAKIDQRVAAFRSLLAGRLKQHPDSLTIVPVSARNKSDYLQTENPEDLADSNFQQLEDAIWRLLTADRGKVVLLPAAREIGTSIAEARSPLVATLATLEGTAAEMKPIEDQLREIAKQFKELGKTDAAWTKKMKTGFDSLRHRLDRDFKTGAIEVRTRLRNLCLTSQNLSDIVGSINGELAALSTQCAKLVQEQARAIAADVERDLPRNSNPFAGGHSPGIDPSLSMPPRHFWDRFNDAAFAKFRGAMKGGLIGGAIGGLVGALFGGIGAIPGSIIGAKVGAGLGAALELGKTFLGIRREDKHRDHYDAVAPEVEKQLVTLQSALGEAVDAVQKQLEEEIREQLIRSREDIERTSSAIHETIRSQFKMSGPEVRRSIEELQARIRQANSLLQELDDLMGEILDEGSSRTASPHAS